MSIPLSCLLLMFKINLSMEASLIKGNHKVFQLTILFCSTNWRTSSTSLSTKRRPRSCPSSFPNNTSTSVGLPMSMTLRREQHRNYGFLVQSPWWFNLPACNQTRVRSTLEFAAMTLLCPQMLFLFAGDFGINIVY